jgi:V/A-type H+-transporting ATPase subunit E
MTVKIEDKIEMFSKLIYGNIDTQFWDDKQKLTENYKQKLDELKAEVQHKRDELMNLATARAESERKKLLAQVRNQQQHMQVALQQKFVEAVIAELYKQMTAYTETPAYKAYLERNVAAAFEALKNSKRIDLYAAEKDLPLCRQLAQREMSNAGPSKNIDVKLISKDIIGGLVAEDSDNQLELDLTLRSILHEKREMIGTEITRKFNEVNSL